MSFRHFPRRDVESDSSDDSSSEGEVSKTASDTTEAVEGRGQLGSSHVDAPITTHSLTREFSAENLSVNSKLPTSNTLPTHPNLEALKSDRITIESRSESSSPDSASASDSASGSDSDSESSTSSDELPLQKPVFIKRKRNPIDVSHSSSANSESRHNATATEAQDVTFNSKSSTATTLGAAESVTGNSLQERILMLNDDDTIDPAGEKARWVQRQEGRSLRQRQKLQLRQQQVEDMEASRLLRQNAPNLELPTKDKLKIQQKAHGKRVNEGSSTEVPKSNSMGHKAQYKRYKPSVVKKSNAVLKQNALPGNYEESEYSVI
ncbi:LAMI_0C06634g1_1 [Lachancea mirantina]|uniref:LAMI_0C06634g1_1 n=1 Tax=Lachancea mirantina TaxID=1230905 RepID=A0A1G4J3F7_9SACH|nr:LAMI_0C06634g1_1 [Lachancea mirantina]